MSSLFNRTLKNTFWLFLSEICAKGAMFLATLYLARVLGVAGFGIFSLGIAIGIYLWTVVDAGVSVYGVREVAQHRDVAHQLLSVLNSMRLTLAAITILLLILYLSVARVNSETIIVFTAGGLYTVVYALSPDWVLKGLERMEYVALSSGAMAISFLASVFSLVKGPEDAVAAILYRSLSFLVGSITALIALRRALNLRFSFSVAFQKWKLHLKDSSYFAVNLGINNITPFIPVFFLGIWSSSAAVGLFSAPQRAVILISNAASVVPMASYPILSSLYISDKQAFCRAHKSFERIILYLGLPVGVIGMLLSAEIITALYGHSYSSASSIFAIIVWLVPLILLRTNYGRTLLSAGYHRFNMFATGSGALVSTLICLFGIRYFGLRAAAWSLIIGEIVTLFVMAFLFQSKIYSAKLFDTYFLKVVGVSVIMSFSLRLARIPLLSSIIAGIALYGILSIITGLVTIQDIKLVWNRVTNKELPTDS